MKRAAPLLAIPFAATVVALVLSLALPWQASAESQAMLLPVDPAPLVAETVAGERVFSVEIADDATERERGLMFRETMPDDRGMLFVFGQTQQLGFWMKNTPLPLDLIFIGENGRIADILPGVPFSEAVITPGVPVRFVLEVKSGIAAKNRIGTGDRLSHPEIDAIAGKPD